MSETALLGVEANHALLCRLPACRNADRPNLFAGVLDILTICPGDHATVGMEEIAGIGAIIRFARENAAQIRARIAMETGNVG